MAFVQRANVVLEVKDDAVERMRDMGYSVIDSQGRVIQGSNVKTVAELQEEIVRLKTICAKQEDEIKRLADECDKLKNESTAQRKRATTNAKKK